MPEVGEPLYLNIPGLGFGVVIGIVRDLAVVRFQNTKVLSLTPSIIERGVETLAAIAKELSS